MFTLINKEATYEKVWDPKDDSPKDQWPVFILKKLSAGEVNGIEDEVTSMATSSNKVSLAVGTYRRLKIKYALISWRNVFIGSNEVASCTDATKDLLPAEVSIWLEQDIDQRNSLRGVPKEDEKKPQ